MSPFVDDKELEGLLSLLASSEKNVRKDGYNQLWSLEESGKLSPKQLVSLLENDRNATVLNYVIDALGRIKKPETFPALAKFFAKCESPILVDKCMDSIQAINEPFFLNVVIEKIGFLGRFRLKDKPRKNCKFDEFLAAKALEYFSTFGSSKILSIVRYYLEHSSSLLRWKALLVVKRLGLQVDKKLVADMAKNDTNPTNRKMAEWIVNGAPVSETNIESEPTDPG